MRTLIASSLLLTIAVVGCTPEASTSAAADPLAPSLLAATAASRPLSGRCETSFDPPQFPLPPVIRQVDIGTCQLSHLGRATIYSVQDIDIAKGEQKSVELTFTAANGDVLRATNVGTSAPNGPGVQFKGSTKFVGGTGRFTNATGEAHIEGTASFITNTAEFTIVTGWITYDAATRER